MTNNELRTPSLLDALVPIVALVVMMGSAVYLFKDNSSYGPNQIALLLAMGLAAIIGMKNGYSWKTIEKGIVDGIFDVIFDGHFGVDLFVRPYFLGAVTRNGILDPVTMATYLA